MISLSLMYSIWGCTVFIQNHRDGVCVCGGGGGGAHFAVDI